MSSCVCKFLFKSEQICGCCCQMLRGSLFWGDTRYIFIDPLSTVLCRVRHRATTRSVGVKCYLPGDDELFGCVEPTADVARVAGRSGGRGQTACRRHRGAQFTLAQLIDRRHVELVAAPCQHHRGREQILVHVVLADNVNAASDTRVNETSKTRSGRPIPHEECRRGAHLPV